MRTIIWLIVGLSMVLSISSALTVRATNASPVGVRQPNTGAHVAPLQSPGDSIDHHTQAAITPRDDTPVLMAWGSNTSNVKLPTLNTNTYGPIDMIAAGINPFEAIKDVADIFGEAEPRRSGAGDKALVESVLQSDIDPGQAPNSCSLPVQMG